MLRWATGEIPFQELGRRQRADRWSGWRASRRCWTRSCSGSRRAGHGGFSDGPTRLGGARYWYFRTKARLDIAPATRSIGRSTGNLSALPVVDFDDTEVRAAAAINGSNAIFETLTSWTDGLIGFRLGGDVSENVSLFLRADVGGLRLRRLIGLQPSGDAWSAMAAGGSLAARWRLRRHGLVAEACGTPCSTGRCWGSGTASESARPLGTGAGGSQRG